jgi:hypothetical protein
MKVVRRDPKSYTSELSSYTTQLVSALDGWTYDITKKTRRKFFIQNEQLILIQEKLVNFIIPSVEYVENVEVTLISKAPYVWKEVGKDFEEVYEILP